MPQEPPKRAGFPHTKVIMVMSPLPRGDQYVTDHRIFTRRPLVGNLEAKGATERQIVLTTGRDRSQVQFPVPWHQRAGPTQSKVHGSFTFKLSTDLPGLVEGIQYSDIGREGTAVYELPAEASSIKDVFRFMKDAKPHARTPHLKTGGEASSIDVSPNKTVLLFGVPRGTIEKSHLYPGVYTDHKGKIRHGFYDEHGNLYPWVVVHIDRKERRGNS